ncbi:MAG: hypothetical protein AAF806_13685 [Bacteroidota bacterium]
MNLKEIQESEPRQRMGGKTTRPTLLDEENHNADREVNDFLLTSKNESQGDSRE